MKRRILLFLDGTWNDDQNNTFDTNIVRLRNRIILALQAHSPQGSDLLHRRSGSVDRPDLSPYVYDGYEYIGFYQRGVGTGPFDSFLGGAFGEGLDKNIRRAYKFLSLHYRLGDEIFVFGFSRGAHTARSLVGYIDSAGLLMCNACTEQNERLAWQYYRTAPADRLPGQWAELGSHVHPRQEVRVACLAVFDTVGTLGIPTQWAHRLNRQRYEFHDVELASSVDVNLQALAIDEHRFAFAASIWRLNKFQYTDAVTEQVWFTGSHSDVGGGFRDYDTGPQMNNDLEDITLDWMVKRVRHHCLSFPFFDEDGLGGDDLMPINMEHTTLHEPRRWYYRLQKFALRLIGNRVVKVRNLERLVSRDRDRCL